MTLRQLLLGIDIGTGGVKAALFEVDGRMVSIGRKEYRFSSPLPGWSELDPEVMWACLTHAVRACVESSGETQPNIAGIGLSVLGETGLAVDANGRPLYPAIESMDKRENAYQAYVSWFASRFGAEEIYRRTSYPLNSLPAIHKVLWLRDHRPEVFSQVAKYVTFQEYVLWRMTGQPRIDYSLASRSMLFDVEHKRWIASYLTEAGLPEDFMSQAVLASEVAGELGDAAAQCLGLTAGTRVICGAHDQSCAALGVGIVEEGLAADGTGSVEAIATASLKPLTSPETMRVGIGSQCHVTADSYLALGFHLAAGSLVRWYRDQFGQTELAEAQRRGLDAYDLLTKAAHSSPPGANGLLVLPHWSGAGTGRVPPLDPTSRGAIYGLTLAHTKADLTRAIFEGITYEARFIIESLENAGIPIHSLVVTGGGAKSAFWLQLKADITGKRVTVPEVTETSLLGAAILAGIGSGIYPNPQAAVAIVCRTVQVVEPDPAVKAAYDRAYFIYQALYPGASAIHARLAETR